MRTIHFTQNELQFMCHSLIYLESTKVKIEKKEFYEAVFDQIPIDWDDSTYGREIELSMEHWKELNYYIEKGFDDWIRLTNERPNIYEEILDKIEGKSCKNCKYEFALYYDKKTGEYTCDCSEIKFREDQYDIFCPEYKKK